MSLPQPPQPAKLVISLLLNDKALFEPVARALVAEFGVSDFISAWMPFDYTTYYAAEMGSPLVRRLIGFKQLIQQEDLSAVKLTTNTIEKRYADSRGRTVNIDPGYLLLERFVLATGKNYTHRIYVGNGIYADLTLVYQNKTFKPLPWTYPDYADPQMIVVLSSMRDSYRLTLQRGA
jgi:hypothetical protein